jgi:hypothetical protein
MKSNHFQNFRKRTGWKKTVFIELFRCDGPPFICHQAPVQANSLSQRSIESIIWRDGWLYSPPPPKKGVFCVCGASLKVRSFRFFLFLFCYQEERGVYIKSSVILLCMPSQFHLFISLTFWLDLDPVSQRENRCRLFVKKGTVQLFDTLQKTLSPLHFFSPPSIDSVCI